MSITLKALDSQDRDSFGKSKWSAKDVTSLLALASKAGTEEVTARDTATKRYSILAYSLDLAGFFTEVGNVKVFADHIGKSSTRVADFRLYGRLVILHGIDNNSDLYKQFVYAAAGGGKKVLGAMIKKSAEDFDLAEFTAAVEKHYADEKEKQAARDAAGGGAAKRAAVLADLTKDGVYKRIETAIEGVAKFAGVWTEDEVAKIEAYAVALRAAVAPKVEDAAEEEVA